MGLEERKGNFYYYEKRRVGDRVVSEYVGSGLIAQLAEHRAVEETLRREAQMHERAEFVRLSAKIDTAVEALTRAADSYLVALGYHQHKREWRKRRNGKDQKERR